MSAKRVIARLASREKLAEEHYKITLAFEGKKDFAPGQFAMLRGPWDRDPILGRPLAILQKNAIGWEFYFRVVGRGTDRMAKDPLESAYELVGPLGTPFSIPKTAKNIWICAGGIGIASVLPIVNNLSPKDTSLQFFFGARDKAGLCLSKNLSEISFHIATDDGSSGHHGFVTELVEQTLQKQNPPDLLFACGPELMMKSVARICLAKNISCQLSLEAPMACGFGVCLGCSRDLAKGRVLICQEGPCLDIHDVYNANMFR